MAREARLMSITGAKGVGKTYLTLHMIGDYIRSKKGRKGRKVLIIDFNKEYTNEQVRKAGLGYNIKMLSINHIKHFAAHKNIEVRRILPYDEQGNEIVDPKEKVQLVEKVMDEFFGGMVIVEDINNYMTNFSHHMKLLGRIVTNRHKDMDLIVAYQSLSALEPRIWQNCNVIRMHFQTDDVRRYRDRIPTYDLVKIAQLLVNNQYYKKGNIRFYLYIDMNKRKLYGRFNRNDFVEACIQYMQEETAIGKKEKNDVSKKAAYLKVIKEVYNVYYGNKK